MATSYRIPIGAQHVAILEPLRFELQTENEKVVEVKADVGYVHRGVEKACASRFSFKQVPYVVARVCGLCAVTHSTCFVQAVEKMMNVDVPKRARYLRIIANEIDRLQSHLICLGHTAENAGFEALFMAGMMDREIVMEMQEILTGNRIQVDYTCVGGVNRDVTPEMAADFKKRVQALRERAGFYVDAFLANPTLKAKHRGTAALTRQDAYAFNVVGPMARAAGVAVDIRTDPANPMPYGELGFKVFTATEGDIMARNQVRLQEFVHCLDLMDRALDNLPEGPIAVDVKGRPEGEAIMRVEAPRGELYYYVRGNKTPVLQRVRIKTPTFSNIPAMVHLLKGVEYHHVPTIIASYDPCLSCTAR